MRKHRPCWSAGHGKGSRGSGKDPGAVSKHGVEADEVRTLAHHLAQDNAALKAHTLFRDTGPYYLADDEAVAFGATRFYELHLDSASGASGVSVLVAPHATEREKGIAWSMCRAIADVLDIPNRGVSVRGDLAVLHQHKDMASVLIEVCFVSSKKDMERFNKRQGELELAMLNVDLAYRGEKSRKKLPRKTWRKRRIKKYLKTV